MREDVSTRLDQSDLLNEQVHADELQEILARLAATDALFADPVTTIRDVAEVTDASPLLIGRILSQMRGPDEVAALKGRMDGFEARLRELEAVRQERSMIPTLLKNSGVGSFRPLSKQWDGIKQPDYKDETFDESWSKVKEWYDSDCSAYAENFGVNQTRQVADQVVKAVLVILIALAIVLAVLNEGTKSPSRIDTFDRPIPFPVERSVR